MSKNATTKWREVAARDILPRQHGRGLFLSMLIEKKVLFGGKGGRATPKRREGSMLM